MISLSERLQSARATDNDVKELLVEIIARRSGISTLEKLEPDGEELQALREEYKAALHSFGEANKLRARICEAWRQEMLKEI